MAQNDCGFEQCNDPYRRFFFLIAKPLIVFLYTDQYLDATPIYRIALLTFFALILRGTTILMAYGNTKFIFYLQVVCMIVSVILSYAMIKSFGTIGAIIAYVTVIFLREFALIYKSKLILSLPFSEWLPWKDMGRILLFSLIPVPLVILILNLNWTVFITLSVSFICYTSVILFIYDRMRIIELRIFKNKILQIISVGTER